MRKRASQIDDRRVSGAPLANRMRLIDQPGRVSGFDNRGDKKVGGAHFLPGEILTPNSYGKPAHYLKYCDLARKPVRFRMRPWRVYLDEQEKDSRRY